MRQESDAHPGGDDRQHRAEVAVSDHVLVAELEQWVANIDQDKVSEVAQSAASTAAALAADAAKAAATAVGGAVERKARTEATNIGLIGALVASGLVLKMVEAVPLLPQALELGGLAALIFLLKT